MRRVALCVPVCAGSWPGQSGAAPQDAIFATAVQADVGPQPDNANRSVAFRVPRSVFFGVKVSLHLRFELLEILVYQLTEDSIPVRV